MLENVEVGFVAYLVKIIHIKLANEGGEIAMPEIDGQDHFLKLLDIFDDEGSAI